MESSTTNEDVAVIPAPAPQPQRSAAPIFLTRDEVLNAPDGRTFANVPVDEWKKGAVLRISSLSSEMRDLLENYVGAQQKAGTQDNIRAYYVWLCAVNPDGSRMFGDVAEVKVLGEKSALPIDRVFRKSIELNDMTDAAVEKEAKNSDSEGGATSSSPSL